MNTKTLFVGLIPFALALAPTLAAADVNQPQEIINRPRTTPGGQLTVGADVAFIKLGDLGNGATLDVLGLYGVNDKLEVGVDYAFALKEFEAKGNLGIGIAYSLLADDKLTVAADVATGFQIVDPSGIEPISLGAEVQFKINDTLAVYTPGHQFTIGIAEETGKGMSIDVPVGVGFQASPQIFAHVDTNLAFIALNDEAGTTGVIGADFFPLAVGAFFSPSNTMDFGASFGFIDLKADAGFFAIVGSARLHM